MMVGRSLSTNEDNQVIWSGIHHKTSRKGGQFGYPDETYLQRVTNELKDRDITPCIAANIIYEPQGEILIEGITLTSKGIEGI